MAVIETISASEFKAKCLDILDRLGDRRLEKVVVTKRGRPVAVLVPPDMTTASINGIHGCMRDSVIIPRDIDLTDEIDTEPFVAEAWLLHG